MTVDVPHTFRATSVSIAEAVWRAREMGRKSKHRSDNTFDWLCDAFQKSPKWMLSQDEGGYAQATKKLWGRELHFASRPDVLGMVPLDEIRPALIRGYLDGFADKPHKQKAALAAFGALSEWAEVRDYIRRDITRGVKVELPNTGHIPWSDEQVEIGITCARPDLGRVILLASETGQRRSDLVKMGPTDLEVYKGTLGIHVKQKKTARKLWQPLSERASLALEQWLRDGHRKETGPFLLDQWGFPWEEKGLSEAWAYEKKINPKLAGLRDLVIHGLRGHKCVKLFREGKNNKEIGTIVGMSTKTVEIYTRFSDQQEDALIIHLRNFQGTKSKKVESSE